MTTMLQVPLVEHERKDGIIVLIDEDTSLYYFKNEGDENVISCPDGKRAFYEIDVHPNFVICKLMTKGIEPIILFRIYLRKWKHVHDTEEWLVNPKAESQWKDNTFVSKEDLAQRRLNFTGIVSTHEEYIQCGYEKIGTLFALRCREWIRVHYWDIETQFYIEEFEKIEVSKFQNKDCLILKKSNTLNPYSIYFFKGGDYFSVPPAPGMRDQEHEVTIFAHTFPTYITIGMGRGTGMIPDYFYVYRLKEKDWIDPRIIRGEKFSSPGKEYRFYGTMFTEKHMAIAIGEDSPTYEILSTDTWEKQEFGFEYSIKSSYFTGVSLGKDGKLIVSINGPDKIKTEV
jgi:hypothetical protein